MVGFGYEDFSPPFFSFFFRYIGQQSSLLTRFSVYNCSHFLRLRSLWSGAVVVPLAVFSFSLSFINGRVGVGPPLLSLPSFLLSSALFLFSPPPSALPSWAFFPPSPGGLIGAPSLIVSPSSEISEVHRHRIGGRCGEWTLLSFGF